MTALIIIAAVLLLLLLAPASVEVSYREGKADVIARYLVLRYDLLKKRPAKTKKEAPAEPPPEKEPPKKRKGNKLKTAWRLLQASRRGLRIFRRHLVFSRVRIFLRVGGEDAHQAGETYAKVNLAVLAALDVIALAFVLRRPEVAVSPDFLNPGIKAGLRLRAGIRPLFAIMAGVSVFRRYLALQKETRTIKRNKGGRQHARTESAAPRQ